MSDSDERFTPRWLFDPLHRFFRFTLDPFTTEANPLGLEKFYTLKTNGLLHSWQGERVFANPPYSGGKIVGCAEKIVAEASPDCFILALVRCDCSQRWYRHLRDNSWHTHEFDKRVKFEGSKGGVPFWGSVAFLLGGPLTKSYKVGISSLSVRGSRSRLKADVKPADLSDLFPHPS